MLDDRKRVYTIQQTQLVCPQFVCCNAGPSIATPVTMYKLLQQSVCLEMSLATCRSITCWALSRYAQWVVERCTDPQQDMAAAQVQLDEVLQVRLSALFFNSINALWH